MKITPSLHITTQEVQTPDLLQQALRVHDEPYRYFDDWQVHAMLCARPLDYLDHLLEQLQGIANGHYALELPHKMVFDDPGASSDFRVMPCVIRQPERIRKTVKLVGTNGEGMIVPDQITVGKAFALHASENYIEAGFAGCLLSSARTGACAATGTRLLANSRSKIHLIGAGRVGYYAAFFIATLGGVEQIQINDRDSERASAVAQLLQQQFPAIDISTCSCDEPVTADVLVLATDSEETIYRGDNSLPNLIISVGADTDWQHELSAELLDRTEIFVDTDDSLNYGDLRQWQADGLMNNRKTSDLMSILQQPPQRQGSALFISTGSALFDNLTIDYLLHNEVHLT